MRNIFLFGLLFFTSGLFAELRSAVWGTEPAAPIYVGQPYELTLTFQTCADETIESWQIKQVDALKEGYKTSEVKDGVRYTVLHWKRIHTQAQTYEIPASVVNAGVKRTQQFCAYMSSSTMTMQRVAVAAFTYEVQPLPEIAVGCPVGRFSLKLFSDKPTYRAGEVRLLTAIIEAHEGYLPSDYTFALEAHTSGTLYPFRMIMRNDQRCVAQAYYVTSDAERVDLCLKGLEVFDLETRTLKPVICPRLTLSMQTDAEMQAEDVMVTMESGVMGQQNQMLRFAPSETAPILGVLEGAWVKEAQVRDWIRVRTDKLSGWIRECNLKD